MASGTSPVYQGILSWLQGDAVHWAGVLRPSPQPPWDTAGWVHHWGGHTGSGGRPWAAVAATPPPPSVMLSCCPAVRGGTWAGHNSCHLIVTPPYFSHGSPSSAFATSPPEPSLLPGTDNTAAAACRGRGAGGRAEALPVASCAGQHQHAASIARVAACSPQLIPSAPPPPVLPTGHGTEVKWLQRGQAQGEDRHASLPACRQHFPPPACVVWAAQKSSLARSLSGHSTSPISGRGEGQRWPQKHPLGASH